MAIPPLGNSSKTRYNLPLSLTQQQVKEHFRDRYDRNDYGQVFTHYARSSHQVQILFSSGGLGEWFKPAVLKTADGKSSVGSNPTASAKKRLNIPTVHIKPYTI